MSLLFVCAQLSASEWDKMSFSARIALVREHYVQRPGWDGIIEQDWFFPQAGIGIYIAYQKQKGKLFHHESRDEHKVDFISHAPFGYRVVAPGHPLDRLPSALARAIDADKSRLTDISPAQNIVTVDEEAESFTFRNDLLGLAKAYVLDVAAGHVIASRPIAAHLMAARKPVLSGLGWAAQQLHGWFMSSLTPFQNTREVLGGTTIRLDCGGFHEARHMHIGKWFTQPPARSMFDGFERFMAEFAEFVDPGEMDVALSGGRDSRASAALFSHFYPEKIFLRTNEPPALEGIIARQLIEALPDFAEFTNARQRANDCRGRVFWKANISKAAEVEVYDRARKWAYVGEGLTLPVAIYGTPPAGPVFSSTASFLPAIAGVAGESAKAYYWSSRMVSGAYARSLKEFEEDISSIPIAERLKDHPLTMQAKIPFIAFEYNSSLMRMIYDGQEEASELSIHGYRFLDYWWLTNRFGVASNFFGSSSVMPFMVPEYISYALQRNPIERSRGQTLSEIVEKYLPVWSNIPYFDEIQNSVPRDQLRAYRDRSLLWEGNLSKEFFDMMHNSPAFEDPYDRDAIISFFRSDIAAGQKQAMNLRALAFVLRNALWNLCEEVGKVIMERRYSPV